MQFTVDLTGLPLHMRERVVKHVVHEDVAQFQLALVEQARLKKLYDEAPVLNRDGIGPLSAICHVGLKNWLAAKFGQRTVYSDPDFMPWLQKKHEEFRGKDVRTKIQIGYTGRSATGTT